MSDLTLDPRIQQELSAVHDDLEHRGELVPVEQLKSSFALFKSMFGPEKLRSLDGDVLLQTMHSHGNKESMVYWLEFKNDDDFPGQHFGSIAGGSAHKFGLFKRKDTGQWVKGGTRSEKVVETAEAIKIARSHRDQLLAGVEAIGKLPVQADDGDYQLLQNDLQRVVPDLVNLAWVHKYFSFLFSDKLDDYHVQQFQRYNLIKLLQLPPPEEGLYVCAGRFVRLAAHLGWPMNHLTAVLNQRNLKPTRYWRIGTRLNKGMNIWEDMRKGSYVAVGWDAMGDLSAFRNAENPKAEIQKRLKEEYPNTSSAESRQAGELRNFLTEIRSGEIEGDIVVAADGNLIRGVGRVIGPYFYQTKDPEGAPHRLPVKWLSTKEWQCPISEGLRTTVFPLGKHPENLIEIEQHILDGQLTSPMTITRSLKPPIGPQQLEGTPGRIQKILERKGQAIIYGPPGTGKTYWARKTAFDLASIGAFGRWYADLEPEEKVKIEGDSTSAGFVRSCTFHPGYGYEDFIEGYRPKTVSDQLSFSLEKGIFQKICNDADGKSEKYILIIDEINRGDIPRIFGELLTLLEMDKRGQKVILPLSGKPFSVPPNVYVIGTMNTADRSIALLDTALRRRFGFVELMPDVTVLGSALVDKSIPLGPWLNALNERIRRHLKRDARNLQVGHAYLLEAGRPVTDFNKFIRILIEDLIPLIEEYCYEDYGTLAQILGSGLVDESKQKIREELFESTRRDDLVQALLEPSPEIMTSTDAAATSEADEEPEAEDSKEEEG